MKRWMTKLCLASAALLSAPSVLGQVNPGELIFAGASLMGDDPQTNGTFLYGSQAGLRRIDSFWPFAPLSIDPWDQSIWSGIGGGIERLTMTGAQFTGRQLVATRYSRVVSIDFDEDGHLLVAAIVYATTPSRWELFQVHRQTGAITTLQVDPFPNPEHFVVRPDRKKAYWTSWSFSSPGVIDARIYELGIPFTGMPRLIASAKYDGVFGAMAYVANAQDGELYVCGNQIGHWLLRVDIRSGLVTPLTTRPPPPTLNWFPFISYDERNDRLWVLQGGKGQDYLHRYQRDGTLEQTVPVGNIGLPRALSLNGVIPGKLEVAPRNLPTTAFILEAGVWGRPGDLGVLAITKPFPLILATGAVDQGGLFSVKLPIPAGTLQPGRPGSIELLGASINLQSLEVLLTQPVAWPKN